MPDDSTAGAVRALVAPRCESCDLLADVRLRDGSMWCDGCNEVALKLGYGGGRGRRIGRSRRG